ncbi:hypothetical protein [Mordavella massiliensis]|uniref:Uncharacterized protein n=1 Tax=Mordavella massiliensis TaxID=1871024 RepID=A0A939BCM8_9CLOT|nr:hypothetical protein [Mordavella massiliensis]MBM6827829.1 hypothetical protein [Mordavella massiliensis]
MVKIKHFIIYSFVLLTGKYINTKTSQNKCPERPCSALRRLDRILLYPINVWVTENSGNTGIQPGFVANALQTVED